MSIHVLDYAFQHPSVEQLHAAGVTIVGRYLGQAMTEPKNMSAAETRALTDAGIDIFTNFEYGANQVLGGARQAQADVSLFRAQRAAVGMPLGRPCYVAADFDVPDFAPSLPNEPQCAKAKLGPLWDYWHVWRTEEGPEVSAGYGGYWMLRRLFDAGLISWGFQTVAWSGGQWEPRACLRQTGVTEFGNGADVDVAERQDIGQWKVGQPVPPRPVPPPQPGPTRAQAMVAARTVLAYLEAH